MSKHPSVTFQAIGLLIFLFTGTFFSAMADNWPVGPGGKPSRHSLSTEYGPEAPDLLWQGSLSSAVALQAVIDGNIAVMSRITNINNVLNGTKIVAHDLTTGDTLWTKGLPADFPDTDWRSRVLAFNDGVVYASRSGNTNSSYMYALDAIDGSIIWKSEGLVSEYGTEGSSFALNGDLIVGNFTSIIRIDAFDGTTVWETDRYAPTSGGQEVAVFGNKGYFWEAGSPGPKIGVIDLESGEYLYSSESLSPGIIQQVAPFVGPDGTVYGPRSMNNVTTDFLFALNDKGSYFEIKWSVPLGFVPFATFGVGPDGTVYAYSQTDEVIRIDPADGNVIDVSEVQLGGDFSQPRMAIDAQGYVFVTNGGFVGGALYSFNPDLTLRWTESIPNVNVGGPAIGANGTMVVCGVGTNVKAYAGSYTLLANFSANNTEICVGDAVQFSDLSNGNITSREWTFEGGVPASSNLPDPVVNYPDAGIFDVTLTVSDGTDMNTLTIEDYVTVYEVPEVTFDALPEFCLTDPAYELTEGEPEGGEYAGPGVTAGFFYPDVAGLGVHSLSYSYMNSEGCSDTAYQTATVTACTGIREQEDEDRLSVFPNPVRDEMSIIYIPDYSGVLYVEFFNPTGLMIFSNAYEVTQNQQFSASFPIIDLKPGIYFLRCAANNSTDVMKIMKE